MFLKCDPEPVIPLLKALQSFHVPHSKSQSPYNGSQAQRAWLPAASLTSSLSVAPHGTL